MESLRLGWIAQMATYSFFSESPCRQWSQPSLNGSETVGEAKNCSCQLVSINIKYCKFFAEPENNAIDNALSRVIKEYFSNSMELK